MLISTFVSAKFNFDLYSRDGAVEFKVLVPLALIRGFCQSLMEFDLKEYSNAEIENAGGNLMHHEDSMSGFPESLQPPAEYNEVQTILVDGGLRFGVSTVCFDLQEDLVWMGNQGGHVTSYYGLGMQKYTSFQVHANNEVRQILPIENGILALMSNSLRCQSRQGIPIYTYSTEAMQEMQCMMQTTESTLLMGGHQDNLLEIDLNRIEEIRQVILRDPKTFQPEHVLDAHAGTLSDFDIHENLLITCGFSSRLGNLSVDRFLMVYDLRVMRAVAPIQLMLDPLLLRFVPSFSSRLAVVSQSGQFQLVETGALTSSSLYMYHLNSQGSPCLTFDVSSTYQAMAFGDAGGYVHLFCSSPDAVFNHFSHPTEFVEPPEPLPFISVDDNVTPLSSIPVPFCNEKYLSDWLPELCKVIHRRTPKINPEILQSMKMVQSIGYAPNPGNRRRNQVPYKSHERKSKSSSKSSIPDCSMDDNAIKIPKRYRKVDVKYTKLGLEDFDFDHYNKTSFAGLEANLPNSYCNSMLQVLYFIEPIRCALLSHHCQQEFCMACELGFLFQMLDNSKGMPCQASNFLRAFRTIPEASALGLILSESDESKKKLNLIRLIQSWNIFILQQLHAETMEINEENSKENEQISGGFDSSHHSFISRLIGTEYFTCNKCRCGNEEKIDSTTILFSLAYPNPEVMSPGKPPPNYTFSDILKRSLCLEQVTQAWCEKCEKYQPTTQARRLKNLPDILSINCGLDSPQSLSFWKTQMELLLEKGNENANKQLFSAGSPSKTCRYGDTCRKKDCKFQHPVKGTSEQPPEETPFISWLPLGLSIELLADGCVEIEDVYDPDKIKNKSENFYNLISVVSHIRDTKGVRKDCLVACIKAAPNYHLRAVGSPVSQWYLFNDFTITPIAQEEATWLSLDWKRPCVLYYSKMNLNEKHTLRVISPITRDIFLNDKTQRNSLHCTTVTPLGVDELHGEGDIVAMDAEFVTLNQEEAVIRSDGTRSTIKPSQMSVARITCIRGQGVLEGVPFIDDYISTQEQVVDYLTKFSGIKPGDLDASLSSKNLTTLKSTYMKLRYLVDCGVKFVGHGLKNDFRVINLIVPPEQVIDTVLLFHLPHQRMVSLRFLAWHFLGLKIQSVTHDSIEDARTALKLYQRYKKLETEDKAHPAVKELYENGRNCQWKVPEMED
uniref:PAN2-PAN3 deadenylation complex catalytic subunit PAN2 n=1 Tax=Strigamia maritima TaxID=126957 RepID=T1JEQ0_STRMM